MVSAPFDAIACLNPAIAIGSSFAILFDSYSTIGLELIWLFALMPLAGGIAAVFFHEIVYKKMQEKIQEVEEDADQGLLEKDTD